MSIIHALRLSRAPAAALTVVGVIWGGLAGLMPDIKTAVGASDAGLGLALLMSAVGSIGAMSAVPWFERRLGHRALPLAGLLLAVAAFYPLLARDVFGLGVAMFCVGASVAILDIVANVRISGLEARHGLHLMNVNHAMYSVGFGVTAWCVGLVRQAGYGPEVVLPVMAGIGLVFAVFMRERPDIAEAASPEAQVPRRPPWVAIGLSGVILFCAFIGENATEAWSALHIERTLGAATGHGSFGPAMLGLLMAVGRFSGQTVADRLDEAALIFWSAVLGAFGALVIAVAVSPAMALVGVGVTGLGIAVIVPSVNSVLGKHCSERQRAFALSRAWMFGVVGFFVGPAMMGLVSEGFGLRVAFVVVAAIIAAILPAIWMLGRRPRPVRT